MGLLIRVASSRARVVYSGARIVRRSAMRVSGVALENRRDVPTFSCLTRDPHIGWSPAVQRISEGIPARRPAAVVPEPP